MSQPPGAAAPQIVDEIDVIWGVEAIARTIGRTQHQTYWQLEQGHLPARKIGRIWAASKRALRSHFEKVA
jgi:hypothetical protein